MALENFSEITKNEVRRGQEAVVNVSVFNSASLHNRKRLNSLQQTSLNSLQRKAQSVERSTHKDVFEFV